MTANSNIRDLSRARTPPSPGGRKISKPLMEKRRRARINNCLSQLKVLVLDAIQNDNYHYSKLEKADILELTVKHIRQIQRRQLAVAVQSSPNALVQYQSGFSECASEVSHYMQAVEGISDSVRIRLLDHLAGSLQKSVSTFSHSAPLSAASSAAAPSVSSVPTFNSPVTATAVGAPPSSLSASVIAVAAAAIKSGLPLPPHLSPGVILPPGVSLDQSPPPLHPHQHHCPSPFSPGNDFPCLSPTRSLPSSIPPQQLHSPLQTVPKLSPVHSSCGVYDFNVNNQFMVSPVSKFSKSDFTNLLTMSSRASSMPTNNNRGRPAEAESSDVWRPWS